ncbi:pilus assembly protein [Marinobacter hydrocarbonoclasticus]|nr:pilus assembly protein [Marinobacter nauticus]
MNIRNLKSQSGVYIVEFAIVASVVFVMLFACMEAARLMYSYQVLSELSRRTARLAIVCSPDLLSAETPVATNAMKDLALFNGELNLPGLNRANLQIEYLDELGGTATQLSFIRHVRSTITGYQHELMIPFFNVTFTAPDFVTLLPSESLGQTRTNTTTFCSGGAV